MPDYDFVTTMLSRERPAPHRYIPFTRVELHDIYRDHDLTPQQRRRIRLKALPSNWRGAWEVSLNYWKHRCAGCNRQIKLYKDHLVPIVAVGCPGSVPSNLIPLCFDCNQSKGGNDFATWWLGYFPKGDTRLTGIIARIHAWQDYCWKDRGWS